MSSTEQMPAAHEFSLKQQLLEKGAHTTYVAQSDLLSVAVKIYASGGENKMHQHPEEDHAFMVLQGQATFHIGSDENIRIVNANEGVMLPAGTNYWFLSSAAENLVMLRVGATRETPKVWRAFPDGRPFDEPTIKNKRNPPTFTPDRYFGT